MAYLLFDTEEEAKQRSREAWEQRLGRPKRPEDVTEFLWGWDVGTDGRTALIVEEHQEKLSPQENSAMITDLTADANWAKPPPILEEK